MIQYLQNFSNLEIGSTKRDLSPFDLVMISIITVSISSLLFLIGGSFRVDLVIISSLLAIVLIVYFFYTPILSNVTQNRHFISMVILESNAGELAVRLQSPDI